jgi:hypothetical protein
VLDEGIAGRSPHTFAPHVHEHLAGIVVVEPTFEGLGERGGSTVATLSV